MTHKYVLTVAGERQKVAERLQDLNSEGEETPYQLPYLSPRRDVKT